MSKDIFESGMMIVTEYATPQTKMLQIANTVGHVGSITPDIAYKLSEAMKEWALENGATPKKIKYNTRQIAHHFYTLVNYLKADALRYDTNCHINAADNKSCEKSMLFEREAREAQEMADYLYSAKEQI